MTFPIVQFHRPKRLLQRHLRTPDCFTPPDRAKFWRLALGTSIQVFFILFHDSPWYNKNQGHVEYFVLL
ncbi:MAG: hypothetical protein UZ08_BCD001002439 [Candidatus Parvibacillus calidus]|jgi:hypothetical protein|nr:MAG: hypothetical protein UZ08_BCD001002439 [Candidatus Parvibacillus calidus]